MIILSHRGYWKAPLEKNAQVAFQRSYNLGYGTETDVRDLSGELIISHDMPTGGEITLNAMLDILAGRPLPLAINIKADGLAMALKSVMDARGVQDWFTFDMSIPETVVQLQLGLPAFTRASEFEYPPPLYDRAIGVWLDAFVGIWWQPSLAEGFLRDGKRVCVVSPELHKRDHIELWSTLASSGLSKHPTLMLCTDLPEEATEYFGLSR